MMESHEEKKLSLQECIKLKKLQGKHKNGDDVEIFCHTDQVEVHQQPEHVIAVNVPRFSVGDPNARDYFHENGYVVVKDIATEVEIEYGKLLFWDFAENKAGMKKSDPTTWIDSNFRKIGSTLTGIMGGAGFGQSDFMWHLRTLPNVSTSFNILYNRDHESPLITSYDGGVMFRPWQHPDLVSACTQSGWYHVDQGRSLRGPQCIQGVLSLTDCNEFTGGLCVIPKSHLHHDELVDSLPSRFAENFIPIPANFHVLKQPQVLPICKAGDMIFWDSRLIHCSTPALSPSEMNLMEPIRLAGYISMTPREWASDEVIQTRVEAYARNMTTSHWSHILTYSISSNPYPQNQRKNLEEANELVQRLVGLV